MTLTERLRAAAASLRAVAAPGGTDLRESARTVALVAVAQTRPTRWLPDGSPDPASYAPVPDPEP